MNTKRHRLLLDCYLSGQVSADQWTEHLKDAEFAKFVASEMGVAKPELTFGVRERAFDAYLLTIAGRWPLDPDKLANITKDAFKAGWTAHKQFDYYEDVRT